MKHICAAKNIALASISTVSEANGQSLDAAQIHANTLIMPGGSSRTLATRPPFCWMPSKPAGAYLRGGAGPPGCRSWYVSVCHQQQQFGRWRSQRVGRAGAVDQ